MCTVWFARLIDVNDRNQNAAGGDSALGRLDEISLQVVTHRNQIPAGGLDLKFSLFEVGHNRVDFQAAFRGAGAQGFNGCRRAVNGRAYTTTGNYAKKNVRSYAYCTPGDVRTGIRTTAYDIILA